MINDSYSKMMSEKLIGGGNDDYTEELRKLTRERVAQQEINDMERELSLLRSGSAPPTVERSFGGSSLNNGDVSEEVMRSDPAYVSYYYQNVNLNPRLPPPLQAKEVWRSNRLLQGQSGNVTGPVIGDRRMDRGVVGGDESLFSMQPNFAGPNVVNKVQNVWGDDGLTRLPHMLQGDKVNAPPVLRFPLSPENRAFEDAESSSQLRAVNASLSRTATHDPQLLARVSSPHMPYVGIARLNSFDRRNVNVPKSYDDVSDMPESLVASLSGLSLSMDTMVDERNQNPVKQNPYLNKNFKGPYSSTSYSGANLPSQYFNGLDEYPLSPSMFGNQVVGNVSPLVDNRGLETRAFTGGLNLGSNSLASAAELRNFARLANRGPGNASQVPFMDPSYLEYLMSNGYSAAALNDLMVNEESLPNGQRDYLALQKAYFEALLQKSHYGGLSNGAFGNSGFGLGFPYNGNPVGPMVLPDFPMCYPSGLRNGGFVGPWPSEQTCISEGSFASLLDEFKGNKTRCFELAEIADHVVEFSTDQYGSRFIQQKLETASTMEKNMVFHEIMPHALPLMTDVFGNYVIQKFFEHGSSSQIRKLAEQLIGHVLTLTLQMYGCRVIQKAIEVVELDQQTRMVAELDGHIMRCVRDQNGNHVIQKCIQCIPEIVIQFIVTTFYEQVVALSTHPYGCRVIQRVLEHCRNPTTQSIVMEEIMQSVCMLAQDQYGNYVIQHALEHGKPHERSAIISQLAGKVVQMSQQKFASNVIEKCLSFGTPEERQIIVDEILGSTADETEPLQVLMKDQFANYVVQKVLETCDDQQLELILNRIKIHLDALKKYTYGKHIVARVEKLVAAGERRISSLSSYSAAQM